MLAYIVGASVVYLSTIHLLRYQRIRRTHRKYAKNHGFLIPPALQRTDGKAPTRSELPMTPVEAQVILLDALLLEFPFMLAKSLEFALFKTYGIETIALLLLQTTEFKDKKLAGRRYSDTALLILSFLLFPIVGPGSGAKETPDPLDPRNALSLARVNWIHSRYKISNDDLLYTLSTFALEPQVWAKQYEWRELSPLEEMAFFVFFSEIGRRMEITGIPNELQELITWAEDYETQYMVANERSRDIATATTDLLLFNIPKFLHPLGVHAVSSLLYDRLRDSIMFVLSISAPCGVAHWLAFTLFNRLPPPPAFLSSAVKLSLNIRAFILRHFFLPRNKVVSAIDAAGNPAFPEGYIQEVVSDNISTSSKAADAQERFAPRMHPTYYVNEPWYMPKASGWALLINSIFVTIGLRADQLGTLRADGYRLETLGPFKFEGKGYEEMREMAERIQGGKLEGPYAIEGALVGSCPFSGA